MENCRCTCTRKYQGQKKDIFSCVWRSDGAATCNFSTGIKHFKLESQYTNNVIYMIVLEYMDH